MLSMPLARYKELGVLVAEQMRSAEHNNINHADVMAKLSDEASTPQELFLLGMFYSELCEIKLYKEENVVDESVEIN